MRINLNIDLFLNPELLYREKVDKNQAMSMVSSVIEEALINLGELVSVSSIVTKIEKEGPNAAN